MILSLATQLHRILLPITFKPEQRRSSSDANFGHSSAYPSCPLLIDILHLLHPSILVPFACFCSLFGNSPIHPYPSRTPRIFGVSNLYLFVVVRSQNQSHVRVCESSFFASLTQMSYQGKSLQITTLLTQDPFELIS